MCLLECHYGGSNIRTFYKLWIARNLCGTIFLTLDSDPIRPINGLFFPEVHLNESHSKCPVRLSRYITHVSTLFAVVHLRVHLLHRRSLTRPTLRTRNPFQVESLLPQYGHLYGLAMHSSPRYLEETFYYLYFSVNSAVRIRISLRQYYYQLIRGLIKMEVV